MYIPKKLKWETLGTFKKHLETETTEKVVLFNGYEIITKTTRYGLYDSQLSCKPIIQTDTSKKRKKKND
jgi:hypothetical protein